MVIEFGKFNCIQFSSVEKAIVAESLEGNIFGKSRAWLE
jgi:hypothetical protein